MKRRTTIIHLLPAVLLIGGCTGYRLAGSGAAGVRSVQIAPIANETGEPGIELELAKALRQQIQFDGRLELERADADANIEITITKFSIEALAFRQDLATAANEYRIRIDAEAVLRDAKSGKTIASAKDFGEARFPFNSDLTTSKRNAFPKAAGELAKYMLDDLIEGW